MPLCPDRSACKRIVRIGFEGAVERISAVDRLDFDQGLIRAVGLARHRAQARLTPTPFRSPRRKPISGFGRLAIVELEAHVAGKDLLTLRGDRVGDRLRNRIDRRNGAGAEGDAGQKDVEAAEPAAESRGAPGERQGRRAGSAMSCNRRLGLHRRTIALDLAGANPNLPEQRLARAVSWVTSSSVMPRSACFENRRSAIWRPVSVSRLPVGSSAISNAGEGARARAIATRCCSPPESWPG